MPEKTKYIIFYRKYSVFGNAYASYICVVDTDDIYHEVGKLYCKSIEHIDSVRYCEHRGDFAKREEYWFSQGYEKISSDLYRSVRPFSEFELPDVEINDKTVLAIIKECGVLHKRLEEYQEFLKQNVDFFKDCITYSITGIHLNCELKDGYLCDADGKRLAISNLTINNYLNYYVSQFYRDFTDSESGKAYIKVDNRNTYVSVSYLR